MRLLSDWVSSMFCQDRIRTGGASVEQMGDHMRNMTRQHDFMGAIIKKLFAVQCGLNGGNRTIHNKFVAPGDIKKNTTWRV